MEDTQNQSQVKTTRRSRTVVYALAAGGLVLAFCAGALVSSFLPTPNDQGPSIERALSEAKAKKMMNDTTDSFRSWREN